MRGNADTRRNNASVPRGVNSSAQSNEGNSTMTNEQKTVVKTVVPKMIFNLAIAIAGFGLVFYAVNNSKENKFQTMPFDRMVELEQFVTNPCESDLLFSQIGDEWYIHFSDLRMPSIDTYKETSAMLPFLNKAHEIIGKKNFNAQKICDVMTKWSF